MRILLSLLVFLLSGCATYDSLSTECENANVSSCIKAGEYSWNLRSSELKPCVSDNTFCIKSSESRSESIARLKNKAIKQYGYACNNGNNKEACLKAGSMLAIRGSQMPISEYKPVAEKAELFFERACELGSAKGCMFRGSAYRAGTQ